MAKLQVSLLTGRTINQGTGKESGKLSTEYLDSVSVCEIDPDDMLLLGIKGNDVVKVTTDFGSIAVKARKSLRGPHSKVVFIPYGPWASVLANPKTHGTGMPSLKGERAVIEHASNEKVLSLKELLKKHFKKE
jgi:formylmethanofuran dehydrogenase subunit D